MNLYLNLKTFLLWCFKCAGFGWCSLVCLADFPAEFECTGGWLFCSALLHCSSTAHLTSLRVWTSTAAVGLVFSPDFRSDTVVTSTSKFTANLHGQGVEADVPPVYLLLPPLPASQGTKISFTSCLISLL